MTPSWPQMWRIFGRIGLFSFGGPAAQIALMHKELVDDRPWMTEAQYLRALSFCMLLPGPEAMQLATYAGWRQRGLAGGLLAGGLFVLPGALVIAVLALAYGAYGEVPAIEALFLGVQATVIVIVIAALRKVASKALQGTAHLAIAIAAFLALFAFDVPFPLVIAVAAIAGAVVLPRMAHEATGGSPMLAPSIRVIVIGGLIWAAPLLLAFATQADFLLEVGLFFSKLAVVTFGGAYAVLAYMTQTVVSDYGWITIPQMMDALGLAETTPGPLILVTQFVGMLAGIGQGGTAIALAAGAMALWVTFVPCFIWIFAFAPLVDWLAGQPRLQAALSGITAAVVGVIANLSLWFALHVLFDQVVAAALGPIRIALPVLPSLQVLPLGLTVIAGGLLLWRKMPLGLTLLIMAMLGLAADFTGLA